MSKLLDHWLDWDNSSASCQCASASAKVDPSASATPSPTHDLFITHLACALAAGDAENKADADNNALIRQICAKGCDVNSQDQEGQTLLHILLKGE